MKKILALLLAAILATVTAACNKPGETPSESEPESGMAEEGLPEGEPDPSTPEGAVAELLIGAKKWDVAAIDACLPDGTTVGAHVPQSLEGTLSAILGRMEYKIGRSTVIGSSATVEVELTAVDAEGAINDGIAKAIAYVAKQQLTGQPVDDYTVVIDEVLSSIDAGSLPAKTTTATAHMILGGDDLWKLDIASEENLPLLDAATGGTVELVGKLKDLADSYGISLGDFL